MKEPVYFIVDSSVLPEVFSKVIEVKALLRTGKAKTINSAVKMAGISRSAYYKYKDFVFPLFEANKTKLITITLLLEHIPGVLSTVLDAIASANGSILTINQNIPVNEVAMVSISFETGKMNKDVDKLLTDIKAVPGVSELNVISRE
jgi:chorismate mutase